MKSELRQESKPKSFLEFYESDIRPTLVDIDLLLKTSDEPIDISIISDIISISEDEVVDIMEYLGISEINKHTFFSIMKNGSSHVCKLFKRELDCGCPYTYTKENIAYIYDLDLEQINSACEELGIKEATSFTLPLLFSKIQIA